MGVRILVVSSSASVFELIENGLTRSQLEVNRAVDAQSCVNVLDEWPADVLILDFDLFGHNGFEVLHEIQSYEDWQTMPIIVISNTAKEDFKLSSETWEDYGVVEVLYKPRLQTSKLVSSINESLKHVSIE